MERGRAICHPGGLTMPQIVPTAEDERSPEGDHLDQPIKATSFRAFELGLLPTNQLLLLARKLKTKTRNCRDGLSCADREQHGEDAK